MGMIATVGGERKNNRGLPVGESSVICICVFLSGTLSLVAAEYYLLMNFLPFFTRIWSLVSALTG